MASLQTLAFTLSLILLIGMISLVLNGSLPLVVGILITMSIFSTGKVLYSNAC